MFSKAIAQAVVTVLLRTTFIYSAFFGEWRFFPGAEETNEIRKIQKRNEYGVESLLKCFQAG